MRTLRSSLLLVVCVGALLALGSTLTVSTAPAATRQVRQRVAVVGDSLAVSPTRDEGFPAVLQERIDGASLPWTVDNFGVRGDTTTGGLRRLDVALRERPRVIVLALGANDGLRGVDIALITRNLREIIVRAQAAGARVLLCGMETPPLRGWPYTVAFHNVFPALARDYELPLVPFLLAGVVLDPAMNMEDRIHPNKAGAKRIGDTVWPVLEPLLRSLTVLASAR